MLGTEDFFFPLKELVLFIPELSPLQSMAKSMGQHIKLLCL